MADNIFTTVSYDVSAAISSLQQLDDKVKQSGERAQDAFDQSEKSSKKFESGLGDANKAANELSGGALSVAADVGVLTGAFFGAAFGVTRLAEAVATGTFGFEQAGSEIDDFINKADRFREFTQGAKDIGNSAVNTQIERQLFLLGRQQQAEARAQNQALASEQAALGNRLAAQRSFYSQLDAVAARSAESRKAAEDKLSDLVARTSERRFLSSISRFSESAQVAKIIQQAESLQKSGGSQNLDAAQSLLDKALGKADGNAASVRRVEQAINDLITARQGEAAAAAQQNSADEQAAGNAKAAVSATQAEAAALREKQRAIQETITANAVARAERSREQQDNRRQQEFDAATLKAKVQIAELDKASRTDVSTGGRAAAAFRGLLSPSSSPLLLSDDEVQRQRTLIDQASALQDKINSNVRRNPTPQGVVDNTGLITEFSALVEEIAGTDNLNAAFKPDLDVLERAQNLLQDIQQSMAEIAGASGFLSGQGPERLNPARPNPTLPSPSATNPAAAGPRPAINQNISVDLQVRGGMIDSDTVQQLTERVAREIRKGTVE